MKRIKINNISSKDEFEKELKSYSPAYYYFNEIDNDLVAFVNFKKENDLSKFIYDIQNNIFYKKNLKFSYSFLQNFNLENLKLNKKENTILKNEEFLNYLKDNEIEIENDLEDYDENFFQDRKKKLKKMKKYLKEKNYNDFQNNNFQINNYYINNVQFINQNVYYS